MAHCIVLHNFFGGVVTEFLKRFFSSHVELKSTNYSSEAPKMGYRARIPASIAMTLQVKEGGYWEDNY